MAEQISSQQALSTSANTTLFSALDGNMTAADWIGYIVSLSDGLEAGIAAKQAVLDGDFEISTSQVAAQTKSLSDALGTTDINGTPTATIVIDGQSYDISSILDSSVYYWANTTGNGKNAQTNYHMREVFTDLGDDAPSGYSDSWDDPPNTAPTLTAGDPSNPLVEDGETLAHVVVAGTDTATVQLTASDADNDATSFNTDGWTDMGGGVVTKAGTYGVAELDTNSGLVTYTLDPSVDLQDGAIEEDSFSMSVNDGTEDSNTVTFTFEIRGTGDWYEGSDGDTFAKGTSSSTGATPGTDLFQATFELEGDAIENLILKVTGTGDYDGQGATDEHAIITGDVTANPVPTLTTQTQHGDNALNDTIGGSYAVAPANIEDGTVDLTITFTKDVSSDSSITLDLTYDYWV